MSTLIVFLARTYWLRRSPKYQLRLYCTSSTYYSPVRQNLGPCPIEFPPTCEVRVNGTQLNANLKGMKKKPGTAPPPDLGKHVRINGTLNRVEMVYVNSQQPVQCKVILIKFTFPITATDIMTIQEVLSRCYACWSHVRRPIDWSIAEGEIQE